MLTTTGLLQCVAQVIVEVVVCIIHPHLMVRLQYYHVGNNNCSANGIRDNQNKNYRKYWFCFYDKRKIYSVVMTMLHLKHIERNICWRDKNCNKQTKTPDSKFICRRSTNRWTSKACDKERKNICEEIFGAISQGMVNNS